MSACDKHKAEPVRGYNQCAGCEIEWMKDRIEQLEREKAELAAEEKALRRLLAMTYCPAHHLYADDGELQDNRKFPPIDFKRDSAGMIASKMHRREFGQISGATATEGGEG